jgi:hypothetical protein
MNDQIGRVVIPLDAASEGGIAIEAAAGLRRARTCPCMASLSKTRTC